MINYLLAAGYVICSTSGIIFMKLGGDSLKLSAGNIWSIQMNWKTLVGFLLYIISFLLWQRLVVKFDLSVMVPILTGLVQVVVLVSGILIFKETHSIVSTIGAVMVIAGIVVMAIANK